MKKTVLLSMLALSAMSMHAQEITMQTDSLNEYHDEWNERMMAPLQPTYLSNSICGFGWDRNWFLEAKGGGTAFIGKPIGCGDFFDRITPVFQVGIGKWFTPSVGGRVEFQGLQFKNANLEKMSYQFVHADFLYNLTGTLGQNDHGVSRWDLVPFFGVGMIRNSDWKNGCNCEAVMSNNHPFAFSYGIQVGYRITNHLHLIAEASGMTTTRSFDAIGKCARFGDTMLNLSAGFSVTLGKAGWKRIVDARPYMRQNEYLMDRCNLLEKQLRDREYQKSKRDSLTLANKNDYRGLISLRMRMARNVNAIETDSNIADLNDSIYDGMMDESGTDSITQLIGVPVFFYFKLGTSTLVDPSQLSNLDELAKVAREQHLKVTVRGAADSATGSPDINAALSEERAKFISKQLVNRGVEKSQIHTISLGGVDSLSPIEANRNSCVILSLDL